jgi:DNA-binding transcriptional MerR regulator
MNEAMRYTVSEVSEQTGFTIDTLRYYERLGLIERIERTGGKRRYRADDIRWLEFVSCLRDTGMPISGMRSFAELCRAGDETIPERIALLDEHRSAVETQIEDMRRRLAAITHKIDYYRGVLAPEGTAGR